MKNLILFFHRLLTKPDLDQPDATSRLQKTFPQQFSQTLLRLIILSMKHI
jgi:hypothetical protein